MKFLEDAWECDGLWAFGYPDLRLSWAIYRLLFGSPLVASANYRKLANMEGHPAARIVHDNFEYGDYLEPNAFMLQTADEVRRLLRPNQGLVLDLNHLDHDMRPDQLARLAHEHRLSFCEAEDRFGVSKLGAYEEAVPKLLSGFLGKVVVHASPDRETDEYEEILSGKRCRFHEKLDVICDYCKPVAIIAEAVPSNKSEAFNMDRTADNLERFLGYIHEYVGRKY
jgi:hypothetical protein